MKIREIYEYLIEMAPLELQEGYDNAGFLFGSLDTEISKVLLALDATSEVIEEAREKGCNLIITHHPLIFGSFKNVLTEDVTGRKLMKLAKYDINVLSMHTNLDKVLVNEVLIKKLGVLTYQQVMDYMRVGYLENPMQMSEYLPFLKKQLSDTGFRYYDAGRPVYKIGCIGGAGDEGLFDAVAQGCDTYVTADVRHHVWLAAKELGINLIDADHFNTENPVIPELCAILSDKYRNIPFITAESGVQVVNYA